MNNFRRIKVLGKDSEKVIYKSYKKQIKIIGEGSAGPKAYFDLIVKDCSFPDVNLLARKLKKFVALQSELIPKLEAYINDVFAREKDVDQVKGIAE